MTETEEGFAVVPAPYQEQDERVRAGERLDQHHDAVPGDSQVGWTSCLVCGFGVKERVKMYSRFWEHLPYAQGEDRVVAWIRTDREKVVTSWEDRDSDAVRSWVLYGTLSGLNNDQLALISLYEANLRP